MKRIKSCRNVLLTTRVQGTEIDSIDKVEKKVALKGLRNKIAYLQQLQINKNVMLASERPTVIEQHFSVTLKN